jgi:hypothetical protein
MCFTQRSTGSVRVVSAAECERERESERWYQDGQTPGALEAILRLLHGFQKGHALVDVHAELEERERERAME